MHLPAFLNPRRLQGRIVGLFLLLLLLVQLASLGWVQQAVQRRAEKSIDLNLRKSEDRLRRELARHLEAEYAKAMVLTSDYGFREALGQLHVDAAGRDTLLDALDNHAKRIGARMAAYVDLEGRLVSSDPKAALIVKAAQGLPAGEPTNEDMRLALVDGEALQLLRTTAHAPGPIGEVVIAFALQSDPLTPIKFDFNVDVALGVLDEEKGWRNTLHAEDPEDLPLLLAQLTRRMQVTEPAKALLWRGNPQRARVVALPALGNDARHSVSSVLWADWAEEIAPSLELQRQLLWLNLAGVLLFALGSVFTARRLIGPIQALRLSAQRLGLGDYQTPVQASSRVLEVEQLAESFESMRQGIRQREAEVQQLAFWDPLTGLPNRAQFFKQLQERLRASREPLALLMLNLDRFKPVNDALGRELGDELLRMVALRLKPFVGQEPQGASLLARLGGDEFALLLDGQDEAQARATALRILKDFEQPLHLASQNVDLGAGIGIAIFPGHAVEADELISLAERAMDLAKRKQAGVLVFEASMDARSPASLGLLSELRRALEQDELRLFLQPKLDLKSEQVHAAEALVRWQHPTRGMVPPMQFIPFAEQTGFVRQLTRWVLEASARFAAEAHAAGLPLRISVNLSTRDLMDADLPQTLQGSMARVGCEAAWLCLEITESAIMDDPQRALATVRALHAAGFRLSIDDFGTGYSSLAYLKQLPVQELKVDQSFVFGMVQDEGDRKIVRSTIELAHNLGLSVVAEGIETQEALDLLAAWACDEGQGYFIARPMPSKDLLNWLQQRSKP